MSKTFTPVSFGSGSWSKITKLGHQFHQSSTFNNTGYWQEKQIDSGSSVLAPIIWPDEGTSIKINYIPITDSENGESPPGYLEDPSGGDSPAESKTFDSPGVLIDETFISTTSGTLMVNITSNVETVNSIRAKFVFEAYKNNTLKFTGGGKNILIDSEGAPPNFHRGCITSYIPDIKNGDHIRFRVTLVFLTNSTDENGNPFGSLRFGPGGDNVSSSAGGNGPARKHIVINSAII